MKNFLLPVLGLLFFCPLFAQQTVPQGINYQAVLRNGNDILENKPAIVTFTILNGSSTGTLVFQEKYDTISNSLGQLILVIGQGTHTGGVPFADIDWSQGPKYLKIEATVDGITTVLGTPQIQSVPYALAAHPIGTAGGDLTGQYPNPNVARLQGNPVSSTLPAPGLVLKWNGSEWAPASDVDTGDNWGTQVAQSAAPLTGNGSNIPLTILPESVTSQFIQNGTIQTIDVADGAITAAKLNSMGANPGQVLKWNGTAWAPTMDEIGIPGSDNSAENEGKLSVQSGTATSSVISSNTANSTNVTLQISGAGLGISESVGTNTITLTNTGDTDPNNDLETGDPAGGDLTGAYPDPTIAANAIGAAEIINASITAADLAAGVIPTSLPPNGPATGDLTGNYPNPDIASNAVGSNEITNGSITAADIAAGVIPTSLPPNGPAAGDLSGNYPNPDIAQNAVGSNEIANGSITAADIAAGVIPTSLPPNGPASGDLAGNYPNPDIAQNAIGPNEIATGAVTTTEILDNTITTADLAAGVIPTSLPPNGPASGDLAGNYPNPDIAQNAVGSNEISNGSVTAIDIAAGVIPTSLPPNGPASGDLTGNYPAPDIAPNAVGSSEIANGSIALVDLAAGVIPTSLPPSGTAGGDLGGTYPNPVVDALQGRPVANSNPSLNQILKWNGSAWAPGTDNTGGSSQSNCGRLLTTGIVGVSGNVNACPDDQYRLTIRGEDKQGLYIDANSGGNVLGARVEANGGSGSNDGIILLARANDNSSNGLIIAADSDNPNDNDVAGIRMVAGGDEFDITEDNNGQEQNYGLYIDLMDNPDNNPNGGDIPDNQRDIGLYVKAQNVTSDYAAYFDGDVGIPHEIEFVNPAFNNTNQWAMYINKTTNSTYYNDLYFQYNDQSAFVMDNQTSTIFYLSDQRLKENIKPLPGLLTQLAELQPVMYNFKQDEAKTPTVGFLSQEVQKLFPYLVQGIENANHEEYLGLNYTGLSVIAIKAIQEQQTIIEAQQTKIENQEARLTSLEKEMAELRALVKSATAEKTDKGSEK